MKPIEYAVAEYKPVAMKALFSGGGDSLVSTHFAMNNGAQEVVHINTGIGVDENPQLSVREYVIETCRKYGWPLREMHPPDRDYRTMVLAKGFPGPGAHSYPYSWLKERCVRQLVREAKVGHPRSAHVGLVTGVRVSESARRMGFVLPVVKVGGQIWIAPMYEFTKVDCLQYIKDHGLEVSNVVKLIGMSGECFCGAFAKPQERITKIAPNFPKLNAKILAMEAEARDSGVRNCIWGVRPRKNRQNYDLPFMPLCVNCHGSSRSGDV